jgi:hypothetical protein
MNSASGAGSRGGMESRLGDKGWGGNLGGRRGSQEGNPFEKKGDYYHHDTYRS